ncbi:uncharacterized protein [Henckelia pumila]|uniref:uncharacterized protein n=1 Tax=Henckelia pumila TaxID=405737 RepID=UPI003C6E5014
MARHGISMCGRAYFPSPQSIVDTEREAVVFEVEQLTRNDVLFVWTSECKYSFHELPCRLTTDPVLALPSGSGGFVVHTDASLQELNMRQRRWMDLLKDYYCEIKCHQGSSNPVVDALSRKVYTVDPKMQKLARLAQDGNTFGFYLQNDGLLCLSGRVVVLDDSTLREEILSQSHRSRFSVRPGSMKMYKDLRTRNWDAIWVVVDRLSKFAHILLYNRYFTFNRMRQYVADESHILHPTEVKLDQDLPFVERPLRILDRKDKMLRNKRIPLVMVQWQRRGTEEATWELECRMRAEHPDLF